MSGNAGVDACGVELQNGRGRGRRRVSGGACGDKQRQRGTNQVEKGGTRTANGGMTLTATEGERVVARAATKSGEKYRLKKNPGEREGKLVARHCDKRKRFRFVQSVRNYTL